MLKEHQPLLILTALPENINTKNQDSTFFYFTFLLFSSIMGQDRTIFTQEEQILAIIADTHVHTLFSGDGSFSSEIMIEKAISLGLSHLCLTDHMDYDYTDGGICFEFDPKKYFDYMTPLKEQYQDRIDLMIGVELGLQPYLSSRHHNLVFSHPFDYVIGSIHLVNSRDPYYPSFFEGREEQTAYREYFECVLQNLKSYTNFDSLGHLDYVVRYGPTKNKNYAWTQYQEILDAILRILIKNEIALEVNTGGYKYGLGEPNPCADILKRYKELGGKLLTIGSDAHDPAYLAYEFSRLRELLISCGFSSYHIFKKRAPMELPL